MKRDTTAVVVAIGAIACAIDPVERLGRASLVKCSRELSAIVKSPNEITPASAFTAGTCYLKCFSTETALDPPPTAGVPGNSPHLAATSGTKRVLSSSTRGTFGYDGYGSRRRNTHRQRWTFASSRSYFLLIALVRSLAVDGDQLVQLFRQWTSNGITRANSRIKRSVNHKLPRPTGGASGRLSLC